MPRRSGVTGLPPEIRDELNARLVANGFSGYEALSEWLEEQGYSLSKSALHRHGSVLEADFEAAMSDVQRTTALRFSKHATTSRKFSVCGPTRIGRPKNAGSRMLCPPFGTSEPPTKARSA